MPIFVPAILEADPQAIQQQLRELDGLVDRIQIDFADLTLVENQTALPTYCPVIGLAAKVEAHLMVSRPTQYLAILAKQGYDRVVVHVESSEPVADVQRQAQALGLGFAVAINPDTPVDKLPAELEGIDFVQVMGVQPGFGGQPFIEATYDKIRALKANYDAVVVAVDGGVRLSNAPSLVEAGAELLIVGRRGFATEGSVASGIEAWQSFLDDSSSY